MRIRSLLIILAACGAACGCAESSQDPATGQWRVEPEREVRTGSRLPTSDPAATSGTRQMSREDWMDQKARQGASASRQ